MSALLKRCRPFAAVLLVAVAGAQNRPPAVPLVTHDPYFSVWSFNDALNDGVTHHWTGAPQPLRSLIRIDGTTYRLMGADPVDAPALPQTGLKVWPTRTVYTFQGAGTEVRLTFESPLLPDDLDVFSRPATYVTWSVRSTDGKAHETEVYFDADGRLAVNVPAQNVVWDRTRTGGLTALRIGSEDQPVLAKRGDNLRIDWGHLYVAANAPARLGLSAESVAEFVRSGHLPDRDEPSHPRPAGDGVSAAFDLAFGNVGAATVSKHAVVAYDDEYSIQFMGHDLRPYWRRKGMDGKGMVAAAERDYPRLTARCETFDKEVTDDLTRVGGADYATIGSLAYRQSFAAQKVVADAKGEPLMFSKENFSNGCISTVDVLYPAAPQMLLFSPTLTKASLMPILEYAASPRWRWPFAPHDLGTYPKANGQVYGGGEVSEENQMPVEETGNMLILLAALAKEEGNANFAGQFWPVLSKWAGYLADKGFDPESQLSTDDFAGHLAHNVNLSAKAIEALGAYASLCQSRGLSEEAAKYRTLAQSFAGRWIREAADGDHYRLAFDRPGTWSQKYNLVWDRVLGFHFFPPAVAREELDFYRTVSNPYGLPLDNRRDYTKLDWLLWTATLTGERSDFDFIVHPIVKYLDATPDRVPMSDWFHTIEPRKAGFQARSVVGGVFVKLLDDAAWAKYSKRDHAVVGGWAPLPTPPVLTQVVPTAAKAPVEWSYTFEPPAEGWTAPGFDDSGWKKGPAGFGHGDAPGGTIRTDWTSDDIWIRREFTVSASDLKDLELYIQHDDDAQVYVNGVLAADLGGANRYEPIELSRAAKAALKPGRNVVAIHCKNTGGDQYIDAGFVTARLLP